MKFNKKRLCCLIFSILIIFNCLPTTAFAIENIDIKAKAAILADPESDMILYQKNANEKMYPASTTKIMTALLTLENAKLTDVVTIQKQDFAGMGTWGSSGGLLVGEEITVEDLLYCLMLPSANEAANALARHISGNIEDFVTLMNKRAIQLGCKNTNFANPNGLHNDNHYTTAYDLFLIAREAMKIETFAEIVNTAQKTLKPTNMHPESRKIFTTNRLILRKSDSCYYSKCDGIKTGFTTPAGYCLVSTATNKGSTLISVVLGCENPENEFPLSFTETKRLFEWGFSSFSKKTLVSEGDTISEVPVRLSSEKDYVILIAETDLSAIVPSDLEISDLTLTKNIEDDVVAPITVGQKLGEMDVSYNGTNYGTVNLVAVSDVSLSKVLYYADKLENFFKSTLFKLIAAIIALIVIIYILLLIFKGNRKKRQKQRRYKTMRSANGRYRRR